MSVNKKKRKTVAKIFFRSVIPIESYIEEELRSYSIYEKRINLPYLFFLLGRIIKNS